MKKWKYSEDVNWLAPEPWGVMLTAETTLQLTNIAGWKLPIFNRECIFQKVHFPASHVSLTRGYIPLDHALRNYFYRLRPSQYRNNEVII